MTAWDKKILQINGPVNTIRMEGEVDGVRKVIYIMMDHHYELDMQTECDNIYSRDIDNYLAEMFLGLNGSSRMYDFFLEIHPTDLQNVKYGMDYNTEINQRFKYIREVSKLFRKLFDFDLKANQINISKSITNVRLHYIDPRIYLHAYFLFPIRDAHLDAYRMLADLNINLNTLSHIIHTITVAKEKYQLILDIIKSYVHLPARKPEKKISLVKFPESHEMTRQMTDQQQQEMELATINYVVYKIFYSYTNANIKTKLTGQIEIVQTYLETLIEEATTMITSFTSIGDIVSATRGKLIQDDAYVSKFNYGLSPLVINDMLTHIWSSLHIHFDRMIYYFTRFMDVYFLRRFLDKTYITNGIVYTGAFHSWAYISILAKQFDFKVTHFSHSSIPNMDELNKKKLGKWTTLIWAQYLNHPLGRNVRM